MLPEYSMYTVEVKCISLEYLVMEFTHRVVAGGRRMGVRPHRAVESKGRQNCWKNEYNKPSFGQTNWGGDSPIKPIVRHFRIMYIFDYTHIDITKLPKQ